MVGGTVPGVVLPAVPGVALREPPHLVYHPAHSAHRNRISRAGALDLCVEVLPPGAVTTLIGGQPAARVGDIVTCVGPPDVIVLGSFTTMFQGQPAAYMGSLTAHGGAIVMGYRKLALG